MHFLEFYNIPLIEFRERSHVLYYDEFADDNNLLF